MRFGLPISLTLHVLAVFAGIWVWSIRQEPLQHDTIIPLKLTTVADVTNIKAMRHKTQRPAKKPLTPPPETSAAHQNPKPLTKPELAPKQPAFDLDALEKALTSDIPKESQMAEVIPLQNEMKNSESGPFNRQEAGEGTAGLVNAKDYIRSRLKNCWFVDTGVPDYDTLIIDVRLRLNKDGSISSIDVLNAAKIIASGNQYWDSAQRNAVNALRKCAPYDGLKTINYSVWSELKLHLDPGEGQ